MSIRDGSADLTWPEAAPAAARPQRRPRGPAPTSETPPTHIGAPRARRQRRVGLGESVRLHADERAEGRGGLAARVARDTLELPLEEALEQATAPSSSKDDHPVPATDFVSPVVAADTIVRDLTIHTRSAEGIASGLQQPKDRSRKDGN